MFIIRRWWRLLWYKGEVHEWTRFAMDKAYYRSSDQTVRYNAFVPDDEHVVSVFDLGDASLEDKICHGTDHVAVPRKKKLRAVIGLPNRAVITEGLRTQVDEPPPRHHILVGWPTDRDRVKDRALALAAAASLLTVIPK